LASDCIRLLESLDASHDLEDIATSEDSQAAADFIFGILRELSSDPQTRIIASLAGGRKTMGALLACCMVLLGRCQDRLCHVLVDPPFDSPRLDPLFFFPEKNQSHRLPECADVYHSAVARLELTDIPFVRVRGWYEQEYRKTSPSYMSMVRMVQELAPDPETYPLITVDLNLGRVYVDDRDVGLSASEFALFSVLVR